MRNATAAFITIAAITLIWPFTIAKANEADRDSSAGSSYRPSTESRAQRFETLRQQRLAALREIDKRNQRLRFIDKELSTLRDQLTSPGTLGSMGYGGSNISANSTSPARLTLQNEVLEKQLRAKKSELSRKNLT